MLRNVVVAAALLLAACAGKDGAVGPMGPPGPMAKTVVWVDSTGAKVTLDGFVDSYGHAHYLDSANNAYPVDVESGKLMPSELAVAYSAGNCSGPQYAII